MAVSFTGPEDIPMIERPVLQHARVALDSAELQESSSVASQTCPERAIDWISTSS
jgi:hypothetical protein